MLWCWLLVNRLSSLNRLFFNRKCFSWARAYKKKWVSFQQYTHLWYALGVVVGDIRYAQYRSSSSLSCSIKHPPMLFTQSRAQSERVASRATTTHPHRPFVQIFAQLYTVWLLACNQHPWNHHHPLRSPYRPYRPIWTGANVYNTCDLCPVMLSILQLVAMRAWHTACSSRLSVSAFLL